MIKRLLAALPERALAFCTVASVAAGLSIAAPCLAGGSANFQLTGKGEQGGVLLGNVGRGFSVQFEGREVRVSDSGVFIIGLGRDAPSSLELEVISPSGERTIQDIDVAQRQYNVQRVDGVPQHTVTPPKKMLARIRKESAQVRETRTRDDNRMDFLGGFVWPLKGSITGVYGSQRVYNGVPKSPHYGIDIAAPEGELVRAPAPGVVTLVHSDMYYSGGTLIIDHGHGLSSTFIHLSESLVSVGQRIETGDAIARVGSTGRSTGPHLDWRMNWFDVRIDPQLVLEALPVR